MGKGIARGEVDGFEPTVVSNWEAEPPMEEPSPRGKGITKDKDGNRIQAKTDGQLDLVDAIYNSQITFAGGPAGTGKTYLAIACAVDLLRRRKVSKIILSRPAVEAGTSMGFLPGDKDEKIQPYLRPFITSLNKICSPDEYKKYMDRGIIEIYPLAYMRGDTLDDAFVILDEAQNAGRDEIKMFLTRMGENSTYVITGDVEQVDRKVRYITGLAEAMAIMEGIEGISVVELGIEDIVRHRLVREIIAAYRDRDDALAAEKERLGR